MPFESQKPEEKFKILLPTETVKEIKRRAKEAGLSVVEYLQLVFLDKETKSKKD